MWIIDHDLRVESINGKCIISGVHLVGYDGRWLIVSDPTVIGLADGRLMKTYLLLAIDEDSGDVEIPLADLQNQRLRLQAEENFL